MTLPRPSSIVLAGALSAFSLALFAGLSSRAAAAPPPALETVANVRGRLLGAGKLISEVYVAAADPRRFTWRLAAPGVAPDPRALGANVSRGVCVALLSSTPAPPHDPVAVTLTGGRATPSMAVLTPGTHLSFKNADPFPHVLYEVGGESFLPSPSGPGATRDYTAAAPGLHQLRDQLFPSVVMYVWVDAGAVEAVMPDRDGSFAISVPPGDYTARAFFEGKPLGSAAPVKVPGPDARVLLTLDLGGASSK